MADYYGLLARAIGALERNDEASRREIYVKARSALIRQLKAITPPLPPAEISKQRLALEEAIRRVEREAVEAASASMLSPEEIARRAEEALEQALAPSSEPAEGQPRPSEFGGDALRRPPPPPPGAPPPRQPSGPSFEPPPTPEPEVMSPGEIPAEEPAPRAGEDFAEVVRPRPADRAGQRATGWERAPRVTDVEDTTAPAAPAAPPADNRSAKRRRGGRGWEKSPRPHGRRSFMGFLLGLALVVAVLGVGGYFIWQEYGDEIVELFGGEVAEEQPDIVVVEGDPAEPGEGVEIEEPPPFVETVGYLYPEPNNESPISDRAEAEVAWALSEDENGNAVVTATLTIPDRGLGITVEFAKSTAAEFSHEIVVLVTQSAAFQSDPLQSVENLSVKSSEEGIGAALEGDVLSEPNLFLLLLPAANEILNTNRLTGSPWFDLALVYESGERAIVAFNKGTDGDAIFADAAAQWAEE